VTRPTHRMTRTGRGVAAKTAALAVLACILVLVVAAGSNRSTARVGSSSGPAHWPNLAGDLIVIALATCLACAALIVYALWRGRPRRREPELVRELPRVPWTDKVFAFFLLAAVLGGMIAALVFAARNNSGAGADQPPLIPGTSLPEPDGQGVSSGAPFAIHWWILLGLVIVVVVGVVVFLIVQRRGDPARMAPRRPARHERVRAAVQESLEEIAGETDPRRAVIRAYVRMEQILARSGLGRLPHEAPVEYLERALAGIQVSRSSAERLTSLFVRARFSDHVVDFGLKEEAIAALTAVRDELQAAAQ